VEKDIHCETTTQKKLDNWYFPHSGICCQDEITTSYVQRPFYYAQLLCHGNSARRNTRRKTDILSFSQRKYTFSYAMQKAATNSWQNTSEIEIC
jgi:hypothetical protein